MKRKDFLSKTIKAGITASVIPIVASAKSKDSKGEKKEIEQVGFNHIPNKEYKTMNTILHKASSRGHANHGWLDSHHTFSFANYHNPDRMSFGVLRVLNDDRVAPGQGFSTHPHNNMEIISIPLEGDLEHKDSMSNVSVIKEGDVQVMSAGTGVYHSEYNKNPDQEVKFLQIWIFPRERNVTPRYDQISIKEIEEKNSFSQILSPNADDAGVWIHQDAWFHLGNFDSGKGDEYKLKKTGNGIYVFVLKGKVEVSGQELEERDGYGIWDTDGISLKASEDARVLLMEVPMTS